MKPFRWNHEKNERLKVERNISFEEIVLAIEADGLLDIVAHSNLDKYPRQRMFVVAVEQYAYLVPFVKKLITTSSKRLFRTGRQLAST